MKLEMYFYVLLCPAQPLFLTAVYTLVLCAVCSGTWITTPCGRVRPLPSAALRSSCTPSRWVGVARGLWDVAPCAPLACRAKCSLSSLPVPAFPSRDPAATGPPGRQQQEVGDGASRDSGGAAGGGGHRCERLCR